MGHYHSFCNVIRKDYSSLWEFLVLIVDSFNFDSSIVALDCQISIRNMWIENLFYSFRMSRRVYDMNTYTCSYTGQYIFCAADIGCLNKQQG